MALRHKKDPSHILLISNRFLSYSNPFAQNSFIPFIQRHIRVHLLNMQMYLLSDVITQSRHLEGWSCSTGFTSYRRHCHLGDLAVSIHSFCNQFLTEIFISIIFWSSSLNHRQLFSCRLLLIDGVSCQIGLWKQTGVLNVNKTTGERFPVLLIILT